MSFNYVQITAVDEVALNVCTSYDEDADNGDFETLVILAGQTHRVDVIDENEGPDGKFFDIQFGDGTMAYQVDQSWFNIEEA